MQIRERDLDAGPLGALAAAAVTRAAGRRTRIVVNDRLDVALAAGAGVHLRADGVPVARARAIAPPGMLIGRSIHDLSEASDATGADYAIFGSVFPTRSKPDAAAAGLDRLATIARAVAAPVLAIGGVTPENARACLDAGAAGVAAIGVFLPEGREPGSLGAARAVAGLRARLTAISRSSTVAAAD